MSGRRVDIFIHQPVRNARASKRVRDAKMGDYCANCGCTAGSHQQGTMNCPIKGPGSGFKPDQKFTPIKDGAKDQTGRHHPETGGQRTPIADAVHRILDGKVFAKDAENSQTKAIWKKLENGTISRGEAIKQLRAAGLSLEYIRGMMDG